MRGFPWVNSGGGSGVSGEHVIIVVVRWSPLAAVLLMIVVMVVGPSEFSLLFLGLFVVPALIRLRGLNVLDNFNRGRIYGYIRGKPGCTFSDLKTELKMLNGNLAYHLAVLEKVGLIKSAKDGRTRRHFAGDAVGRIKPDSFLGKTESMVLSKLRSVGSVSTTKVAEALGMSRQRAHYNLRRLMRRGLVESTPMGWRVVELGKEESET
jgi:predicted transcriptional regulator